MQSVKTIRCITQDSGRLVIRSAVRGYFMAAKQLSVQ